MHINRPRQLLFIFAIILPEMKSVLALILILSVTSVFAQLPSWDTTLSVDNKFFHITVTQINENTAVIVIKRNARTILIEKLKTNGMPTVDVKKFNNDRFADVLLTYVNNNPFTYLFLFDPRKDTYRQVKHFIDYPEALPLSNCPGLYYSYHRSGCADLNWASDLFRIDNYEAVQIGNLRAQGCDSPYSIDIYKTISTGKNKIRVETQPYPSTMDKWTFIDYYWNKNFKRFK